ncbi:MAG: DUF362 domain-containing protein [Chloroflexi bacterium]|nr:DUF362 domain-containing protein [Chloroflexota bacterium]
MATLSRREFLRGVAATGAALAFGNLMIPPARAALPPRRVVHVHSNAATNWDYATGWYGDYVNQTVVDALTDRGVTDLTNTATRADAWHALIPAYVAGQKVAIKINLNNADCGDSDQTIDALPQPINSIIRGLKAIGVAETDIWVYDVTNGWHNGEMPTRLVNKVTTLYPSVQFHSNEPGCSIALGYSGSQRIHFKVPPGKPAISDRPICNALVNADYLINLPIMKKHGMAGVTLGFKNHFGSFDRCDLVHWSVDLGDGAYVATYNGLIDLYNNPHIKNKTVLVVGDALFGARIDNYSEVPSVWTTFGNKSPNSLFFSADPVAIDCVMYDFLDAEGGVPTGSDDYLKLANTAGLGAYEHWDGAQQYHLIDYRRISLDATPGWNYLPLISRGE